jgi:signal peptidase II
VQERRPEPALTSPARPRAISGLSVAVAALVIAIDHATQWWALHALDDRNIDLVWKLRLNLVHNQGGAFGLGSKYAPLFALAALALVLVLFRSSLGFDSLVARIAVGMVLGGAVGNLLDRLFRDGSGFLGGRVVDFIDIQFWPVWNVADMGISCGAILLALFAGREQTS